MSTPLPENIDFTRDFEQFIDQFTDLYQDVAYKANRKENGLYPENVEISNSQRFFTLGNPQALRPGFRKVFAFGALAAGAALNIPHNIDVITLVTNLYGGITTAVPDDRPLPSVDSILATNQVMVRRNGLNIVVVNGATAPAIVSGFVVMEYLKN